MKKQGLNPFLPGYEYIPDGEPYVFDGRVYVYGSHDAFNGRNYCVNDYVCWSAPIDDLGDWRYEGVIYRKIQDPFIRENKLECELYAPDLQKGIDGRYYLYYFYTHRSAIAVAVCDEPAGKYEFYGYVHYPDGTLLGEKDGDVFQFDPGVYEEDGHVYLYTGFCPDDGFPWEFIDMPQQKVTGAVVTELEPDMLTIKKPPEKIVPYVGNSEGTGFEGHEFFEASSMRKAGDTYYFIYSSINGHELCYATSKYPDRDFKFGGTIISNGDIYLDGRDREHALNYYGNNHGSIVKINNQWYIFYHRHTNRIQFSRQACAEKIFFDNNGNIPQVEITSCGLNDGPLKGIGRYEARIACNLWSREGTCVYGLGDRPVGSVHPYFTQEGEDRDDNPNQYIANMNDGSVAGFKYFEIDDVSSVSAVVRGNGEGSLEVYTALNKPPVAVIRLKPGESWDMYKAPINIEKGVHALYFRFSGSGRYDFMSFELAN